jgi:hypothetical protein
VCNIALIEPVESPSHISSLVTIVKDIYNTIGEMDEGIDQLLIIRDYNYESFAAVFDDDHHNIVMKRLHTPEQLAELSKDVLIAQFMNNQIYFISVELREHMKDIIIGKIQKNKQLDCLIKVTQILPLQRYAVVSSHMEEFLFPYGSLVAASLQSSSHSTSFFFSLQQIFAPNLHLQVHLIVNLNECWFVLIFLIKVCNLPLDWSF